MFQSVHAGAVKGGGGAVVLGVVQGTRGKAEAGAGRWAKDGAARAALARPECTGEVGAVAEAFPSGGRGAPERLIVVGLGAREGLSLERVRTAASAAGRRLSATRATSAVFDFSAAQGGAPLEGARIGQAIGEVMGLLSFPAGMLKGSAGNQKRPLAKITVDVADAGARAGLRRGLALAASTNMARRWAHTPPNIATPMWMAREAQKMARGVTGLSVSVMRGAALTRERMTGLLNVGKASENEACLIRVAWRPRGKASGAKPVVLVGKTVTYDTGGLSIKPTASMKGMKGDKAGGCAVLAAMHALATVVKPKGPVVALLVAAENSISEGAYRPDDVLTFRNGVTVEVTNTDAEGRLVLADALCWACDREKPACIIDLATLTGGVVTALGSTYCGMFCEDDALRGRVECAAAGSGERVWRLPMHQEYRDMMKSTVADIVNSNPNRKAHPIQGAAFLDFFVKKGVPWCHLDIAGVADAEADSGPFAKDTPTGWGVRLLAEALASG
jgi:leucyl aminopeptidase